MKLFLDTADVAQVREAWSWGIVDGVTTNPSHVSKTGRRAQDVYAEILDIVDGPVSLEAVSLTAPEIVAEGRALAKLHKNVVVKVPLLKEGLKAVKILSAEGIKTILDQLGLKDPKAKAAKPQDFIDARFVEEFDKSGNIDGLYGKKK